MNVLVVVESCFGNTSRVGEAIAEGIRSRDLAVTTAQASTMPGLTGVDLLLVGAPTHNMGLPRAASRQQARSKGGNPPPTGVAEWLETIVVRAGQRAVAFDTVTGTGVFSGSAAKRIEKRLRARAVDVVDRHSFLVEGVGGPLVEGELARARQWGLSLV